MTALHLPGPHLCPACNIVHDLKRERLPSFDDLRPYFGTFLPIAGTGNTPVHVSASGTFTGNGQSIGITLDRLGLWVIVCTGNETGAVQSYAWSSGGLPQMSYTLSWPGGSTSATIAPTADGSGGNAHSNAPFATVPQALVTGPGAVSFTCSMFATVVNIPMTLQAWFVPTPQYRK